MLQGEGGREGGRREGGREVWREGGRTGGIGRRPRSVRSPGHEVFAVNERVEKTLHLGVGGSRYRSREGDSRSRSSSIKVQLSSSIKLQQAINLEALSLFLSLHLFWRAAAATGHERVMMVVAP